MAMIASSTSRPSAKINDPSVIRSKSLPVAAMTTNTAASVSGTAAATTMPTRHPMLSVGAESPAGIWGDVGELQGAALRGDGRVPDGLEVVDRAVEPDENLR